MFRDIFQGSFFNQCRGFRDLAGTFVSCFGTFSKGVSSISVGASVECVEWDAKVWPMMAVSSEELMD